jgi:hypothetical protein
MAKKKKKKAKRKIWPFAVAVVALLGAGVTYLQLTKERLPGLLPPPSALSEEFGASEPHRQRMWRLEGVDVVYREVRGGALRQRSLQPDNYKRVYQTLIDAREVRGPREPLAARFEGKGAFQFRFPLMPQGKVAAGREAPCQELQFCAEGDLFRLRHRSGRWHYFEREGVRAEVLRVL